MRNSCSPEIMRLAGRLGILLCLFLTACGGGGSSSSSSAILSADCGKPGSRCGGTVDGMEYILYTPANFKANTGALVMALHPLRGTGGNMENLTGLNAKADQAGFAVLYPSTPNRAIWCWYFVWFAPGCDDIQPLRTIISTVQATLKADPKRIYALGISDGALMVHRVGVEMGDVVAAIAPVSGLLYSTIDSKAIVMPAAKSTVSVLIIQNDAPLNDGAYVCGWTSSGNNETKPSQDVAFNYWTGPLANDCATTNTTEPICTSSGWSLNEKRATGCKGSSEVQFYAMGGYHVWYGMAGNWSVPLNNPASGQPYHPSFNATTGITTNDIVWNFFAAHPKP